MGEHTFVRIYKRMKPRSVFSNTFDETCWKLLEAGEDQKKIEEIYRNIGFVNPNGGIFDLMMRFIERNNAHYQTNSGVLGSEHLPNLFLQYKFEFHDFWLSVLKPNELTMNEHNTINIEINGSTILERFREMEKQNRNNPSFKNSEIYKLFHLSTKWQPSLSQTIDETDIINIIVGPIYSGEGDVYKENARKSITKQRKDIADQFYIPHWAKTKA